MRFQIAILASAMLVAGCSRKAAFKPPAPSAYGSQVVEVSGGKQVAGVGSTLPQPVIVQVNDEKGNALTGALVSLRGEGLQLTPAQALSDSSGQVTATVQLGFNAGDYQITADTPKQGGGTAASLNLRQTALGYEATLGNAVSDQYCVRCHDPESTATRVSNFDNLSPSPHQFSDGATYNRLSDSDVTNFIAHGGPGAGKSAQMPAYGATLKPAEIKALVAYIRAIADPPYQSPGVKYGK